MSALTEARIKHMVDRFLQWRLPENFNPDCGIIFTPEYNVEWNAKQGKPPERHKPVGTNLFDAVQADTMVRHMVAGMMMVDDEMLAALKEAAYFIQAPAEDLKESVLYRIRTAIAKAEGRW